MSSEVLDARSRYSDAAPSSAPSRSSHFGCMVCGDRAENPWSLGLVFTETADGWVEARFRPTVRHQGYDGLLHGGMVGTLLDAAMTHRLFSLGVRRPLTAELTVRYRRPVHLGRSVEVRARLRGRERNVLLTEGIIARDGEILARAVAKHMEPRDRLPPRDSA